MRIIAIDPGTTASALVVWDGRQIISALEHSNDAILALVKSIREEKPEDDRLLAIEMIASYGMAVGKEVFETCVWIGRFVQVWVPYTPQLVYRRDVKMHHCHSARATDANVRMALIDRFGQPGTKKAPGLTYPLKGHMWQAFAIAVCLLDQHDIAARQPALIQP